MNDRFFLEWLAERLIKVYGESPNVDFVTKLQSIAAAMPVSIETPNNHEVTSTIKGERFWTGGFTIMKEDDPDLSVGEVRWFETKETGLIRPLTRKRWRVKSRIEREDTVSYELEPV